MPDFTAWTLASYKAGALRPER
ncbi:Protein of unknown function [Propionibacterium freudenreichii]|nr:Protein of unknown function [Propionibacterium freudenreichii]